MASRIAGITIEIGGDTTKLQSSLKSLDSSIKSTKNELKDIDKLLKFDPSSTELLRQKQVRLKEAISDTENRLTELKNAQSGVAEGSKEWDALQREIIATENDLKALKEEQRAFGNVASQVLKAAGSKMQEFGGKIQKVGKKLQPLSTAATGALTALGGLAYKSVQSADELNTLAKQTGLTTDEIQELQYASDFVDVSFDAMTGALRKLKPKITEDNKALQELGVSTKNADGSTRNATDVFYDAVAALGQVKNETERDQLAMELFGRGADELAGIIDDGGASLRQYTQEAQDLGVVMDGETLDSLNNINDVIDRLKKQGGAALAKLGSTFATAFAPALTKVKGVIEKVTKAIENLTPAQAETILKIVGIVAAVGPLIKTVGKVISIGGTLVKGIGAVVGVLGGPLSIALAAIVAAGVLVYKNWDKIKEYALKLKDALATAWNNIKTTAVTTWENIKTTVSTKWESIKTTITSKITSIKTTITNKWTEIKDTISGKVEDIKTSITNKWEDIKTTISTKITGIKTTVSTKFNQVVSDIKDIFTFDFKLPTLKLPSWSDIKGTLDQIVRSVKEKFTFDFKLPSLKLPSWDTIKGTLDGIVKNVKSKFDFDFHLPKLKLPSWDDMKGTLDGILRNVKSKFDFDFHLPKLKLPTWESIKDTLNSLVDDIKGVFNFTWKLPKFELPHLSIVGGEAPYGLFGKGSLPKISVKWYKKAYEDPVLFNTPTILQTPQGLKGFGDGAGAEIVMGLNKLKQLVGAAGDVNINVYATPGQDVNELADIIQRRFVAMQQQREAAYA